MECVAVILLVTLLVRGLEGRTFEIFNNYREVIWVGIMGNNGMVTPNNGGFKLGRGERITVTVPEGWGGRFWGRTGCNFDQNGNGLCETGDCGRGLNCNGAGGVPPVTLVEITLNGFGGIDYYDISLVDGFNVPVSIAPMNSDAGDGGHYSCKEVSCRANVNERCPSELRQSGSGGVVACKSACLAFNTDEYCCRGAHDTPETCRSSDWPVNYPLLFKNACPDAYSYAYDDHKSTFTCSKTNYLVKFG
uniref:Thaumatin-like protein n=1 Tax=Timema cristinae TaxID=61476 RepID=A0A7R9DLD6_TIMCR|nr:unnamed protein product [Timema cristinae]